MMLHTHIEHCEQIVSNWFSKDFVKYSTKAPFPRHPVLHREQPAQRIETPPKSCDHPLTSKLRLASASKITQLDQRLSFVHFSSQWWRVCGCAFAHIPEIKKRSEKQRVLYVIIFNHRATGRERKRAREIDPSSIITALNAIKTPFIHLIASSSMKVWVKRGFRPWRWKNNHSNMSWIKNLCIQNPRNEANLFPALVWVEPLESNTRRQTCAIASDDILVDVGKSKVTSAYFECFANAWIMISWSHGTLASFAIGFFPILHGSG